MRGKARYRLPSISDRTLSGYHGAYLLRRPLSEKVEFETITKFDSIAATEGHPARRVAALAR
jgi:hypothetical protein